LAFLKNIEIAFRKLVVRSLARLVRRRDHGPLSLDFAGGKVLFIRQDRIGDVLVSSPVFFALAQRYPKMTMDILLSPNNIAAIEGLPLFRNRWVYEKTPLKVISLIKSIRKQRYDVVVDLMDKTSATTTLLTLLSGARWSIGLEKENSYAFDVVVPLKSQREVHIVERLAELLKPFGIDPDGEKLALSYVLSDQSVAFVEDYLKREDIRPKLFIAVNISAGNETRFWGVSNYRSLCETIRQNLKETPIVMLYKSADGGRAGEIAKGVGGIHLAPQLSFNQFASMIANAAVLITPDTAAVHLAAAFQVPSVVLFVQSDKNWKIWDAYNSPSENLVIDVDDLSQIPVSDVWQALKRLWQKAN
jgi:ADP-heptose:LPS heptosyltransferase